MKVRFPEQYVETSSNIDDEEEAKSDEDDIIQSDMVMY
jgi:hypothetical protein